jgi:hypothetical protein
MRDFVFWEGKVTAVPFFYFLNMVTLVPGTKVGGGRWGFIPRRNILEGVIFVIINN